MPAETDYAALSGSAVDVMRRLLTKASYMPGATTRQTARRIGFGGRSMRRSTSGADASSKPRGHDVQGHRHGLGGVLMASLGLLETALGFTSEQTAMMMAFYLSLDGYGPATNVTSDGVIAMLTDQWFGASAQKEK